MNSSRGFSLIEIIVVLFLIGSLMVIAIPRLRDITDVNIKSASRNISTIVRYLYNEAAFRKRIYRLVFDIDNDYYWTEYLDGSEFKELKDPNFKKKLPFGISVADIETGRLGRKMTGGRDAFLVFLPTGFVDFAVIHLESSNGNYYTLVTKPYTGGIKIYEGYLEIEEIGKELVQK